MAAEDTSLYVGVGSGLALGILINYKYPQKYWLPWTFVLFGGTGLGLVGVFIAND